MSGMRQYLSLFQCLWLTLAASAAHGEGIVTMLSTNSVEITSNYTGTEIAIFGAIERDATTILRGTPYEVVVAIKGPANSLVVRQKERLGPIWVNAEQQKFSDVPGFYAVLSSGKFDTMIDAPMQKGLRLGLKAVTSTFAALDTASDTTLPGEEDFQTALIRLRSSQKLFFQDDEAVSFQRANTFRATLPLPANAPLGRYEVTVYLLSGGTLLAREASGFYVRKIGFEATTASLARTRPLIYGLGTALCALLIGWIASVVFRRD